jgi:hypothetical protein
MQATSEPKELLEQFIDGSSLFAVLEMIQVICGEKAQHISSNWQDEGLSKMWTRAAKRVSEAANSYPVIQLI